MTDYDKILKKVDKLMQKRKYGKATEILEAYMKSTQNSSVMWSMMARVCNLNGNYSRARETAECALQIKPDMKSAMNELFIAYDQLEDFDAAFEVLKRYVKLYDLEITNPKNIVKNAEGHPVIRFNNIKENIQSAADLRKHSFNWFLRAIDSSDIIAVLFEFSFSFSKIVNSDKDVELCELLVENLPSKKTPRNCLAESLIKCGEYDAAITVINDALKMWPSDSLFLETLGAAFLKKGEYDKTIEIVKRAIKSELKPNLNKINDDVQFLDVLTRERFKLKWFYLALAYYRSESLDEALDACEKSLSFDDQMEETIELRKKILEKRNN